MPKVTPAKTPIRPMRMAARDKQRAVSKVDLLAAARAASARHNNDIKAMRKAKAEDKQKKVRYLSCNVLFLRVACVPFPSNFMCHPHGVCKRKRPTVWRSWTRRIPRRKRTSHCAWSSQSCKLSLPPLVDGPHEEGHARGCARSLPHMGGALPTSYQCGC
eukprot:364720-Chlamydomonas_euryale.AAC.4